MGKIVSVAVLLPIDSVLDYVIPDDSDLTKNIIGKRVVVPLGERYVTGVVIDVSDHSEVQNLKPIIEILDEEPIFDDKMIELLIWVSQYYISPLGEVFKTALPPNYNLKSIKEIKILRNPELKELMELQKKAPKRYRLLKLLLETQGKVSFKTIEKELDIKNIAPQLEALEQKGFISIQNAISQVNEPSIKAIGINEQFLNDEERVKAFFDKYENKSPKRTQLVSHLITERDNGRHLVPQTEIVKLFDLSSSIITSLIEQGILIQLNVKKELKTSKEISLANENEKNLSLNDEQKLIYENIKNKLADGYSSHLIYGITGSGKTLVYVNLIKEVLSQGKNILYLLPEISLTPQLVDRIQSFFDMPIAVLHSQLTDNERTQTYRRLSNGEFRICMGVRSSVFAPVPNLGLIIVDEEHDPSYKQENPSPRYNARDTAVMRAYINNIPIVLGSATPSIESWYNVGKGKYSLHKLLKRADGAQLPQITIIDMVKERKEKKEKKYFSDYLLSKIAEKIEKKEGVILFHNRRGYSNQLYCLDCGNVPMCENCDVSLTFHKHSNKLVCHYCGYVSEKPEFCNVCGSDEISLLGYGTERIEEHLAELLSKMNIQAKIKRFDRDTTTRKNAYKNIMHNFISGDIDVLVGTQMISKGINIERVTLVGIVDADMHLFFPDFRANERAFQLFLQTAGRAGRKFDKAGEVVIQTNNPKNSVIRHISNYTIEQFYREEIAVRKQFKYPPFSHFTKIQFTSDDFEKVMHAAKEFHKLLPQEKEGFIFSKPIIPSIPRIRNQYRVQIFIKSSKKIDPSAHQLQNLLHSTLDKFKSTTLGKSIKVSVDVDCYTNL